MKEVKSYLELHCQRLEDFESDRNWIEQHIDFGFSELSMRDFYSQPFSPELIEKYFEGWGKTNGYFTYTNINVFIYNRNYYIHNKDNNTHDYLLFPRTLDDFITDCQRAGIKLYWREVSNDV